MQTTFINPFPTQCPLTYELVNTADNSIVTVTHTGVSLVADPSNGSVSLAIFYPENVSPLPPINASLRARFKGQAVHSGALNFKI